MNLGKPPLFAQKAGNCKPAVQILDSGPFSVHFPFSGEMLYSAMLKKTSAKGVKKMRSVTPMKTAKIGYIVMSSLFCLLGIVLLFTPDASALWIGRLLGIGMIVFGAVKLVGYFSRDLFRLAFQYDLAFGILLMVLGIVTLSHPGDAMSFLCVMFGIPVLADGLFKIQIAVDSRRFGIRRWWLVLVLAALTCVIGVVLVFRPDAGVWALTALMGLSLLCDGVLNLSVALCTVKIVDHQRPDVIETDDYEIGKDE